MIPAKFCWSCGKPIQPGYRFCEVCGAELAATAQSSQATANPAATQATLEQNADEPVDVAAPITDPLTLPQNVAEIRPGGLFDPSRDFIVMHEKFWDWGSGDLLDERGVVIGKMHRVFFSLRARIELLETDGTMGAQIHRKIVAIRQTYDLKDANGVLIGRLRKAILNVIHPKIWLEDATGNHILEARGSFMRFDFVVYDMQGKVVAEINKLDRWRDFFFGGGFLDFADRYAIKIIDKSVDRRLLIGFCIAIDNTMHDRGSDRMRVGPFSFGRGRF